MLFRIPTRTATLWGNHFGPASALAWATLLEDCAAVGVPLKTDISCRPVDADIHVVRQTVEE